MDCVKTVGELKEALKQYPNNMPLRLHASCYDRNGDVKILRYIKPSRWGRKIYKDNPDGSEERIYPRLGLTIEVVQEMDREHRKSQSSVWKNDYRDCLEISNEDPDDMDLDD